MECLGSRSNCITLLVGALSLSVCVSAVAHYGAGHDNWHQGFYSKLRRNDGKGPCCNLMDCRPTQRRMVGDHYEVKVDGEWLPVPNDKINNVVAPDGGAHVCAPRQVGPNKGVLFCVILPSGTCSRKGNANTRAVLPKNGQMDRCAPSSKYITHRTLKPKLT